MQGQLLRAEELQEDEVLETIIQILTPETRPPLRGYYNPGVLGPELQLIESIVTTRCAGQRRCQDGVDGQANETTHLLFLVASIVVYPLILISQKVFFPFLSFIFSNHSHIRLFFKRFIFRRF